MDDESPTRTYGSRARIEHGRRRVLHFNVAHHPTVDWAVQQLREAFPEASPYRYVILDHDSKFDTDVIGFLMATGLRVKRTSAQAPWQNGTAERWVGSCRREILHHIIALNEQHLRRLIRDYVNYHRDDRIHDFLDKDTPNRRQVAGSAAFIIDIAGAKLPSELASASSMLVFALWRRSAVDDTQSASRSHVQKESGCALAVAESLFFCYCSFVICGGLVWRATRTPNVCTNCAALLRVSSTSNEVLATHK